MGEKLVIQGHDIVAEDIRIMYSFAGDKSKELSEKYEADSEGDILGMLDTTPDEEMLEEGVAREVINRVQKLRKSAGLKVDDKVTMFYTVTPSDHSLASIITKFSDYIQTSSKTPIRSLTTPPKSSLKNECFDLKGAKLELVVTPGFPPGYTSGSPSPTGSAPVSPWLNLCLLGSPRVPSRLHIWFPLSYWLSSSLALAQPLLVRISPLCLYWLQSRWVAPPFIRAPYAGSSH